MKIKIFRIDKVYYKFIVLVCVLCIGTNTYSDSSVHELTIEELLQSVNANYPQVIAARLQVVKSKGDYLSALGEFDPKIRSKLRQLPVGGYISKYNNNELDVPTLFNGLKLFGGYRVGVGDFPIYYQNYLTNNKGEYRAGLSLPLLKDRIIDSPRSELLTKKETIAINQQDVISTKLAVFHEAINAYWIWVQAGMQLKVLKDILALAEIRQKALEKQVQLGDLANIAAVENKQIIMQRKQWVNRAQMDLDQAAINLSLYYRNKDGTLILPSENILPAKIPTFRPNIVNSGEIEQQIKVHPDLCKLERYYRIVEIKHQLARNELLPSLDTTAFASKQYGIDGYPLLLPQAVQLGVRFKFPIYQRVARGKVISAKSELRQVLTKRQFIHNKLTNSLNNLWVTLRTFEKQVNLLEEELGLAKKVAGAERSNFFAGGGSIFLINQREQKVAEVNLNLIAAKINLQKTQNLIKYYASTNITKLG